MSGLTPDAADRGLLGHIDLAEGNGLYGARAKMRLVLQALDVPSLQQDLLVTGMSSLIRALVTQGLYRLDVGLQGDVLWLQAHDLAEAPPLGDLLRPVRSAGGWRFEARLPPGTAPPDWAALTDIVGRRNRTQLIDDLTAHQASLEQEIERRTRALASSELRSRTVIDGAPLAVVLVDQTGRVTDWNVVAEQTFGHTAEQAIGQRLQPLIQLEGQPVLVGVLSRGLDEEARRMTNGRFWDLTALRRNGSRIPVEAGVTVFPTGEVWHGTLFARDTSERKMVEAALQAAKASAESAATMKANFLANMSHEIRTPMNAILGMSHLALRTDLSPRQRDYVAKIQQSGQHLLGIINDILDFSKIEADKLVIEHTEFELERVLETVSNLIAEKAAEKGLELVFDVGSDVPMNLLGDPLRLGQILTNYANNAVKFTESGEIDVIVRLRERSDDEVLLYFAVKDSGIGLSNEQAGRLFQSFQQADTSTTRKYGGTGLGLAISKKLAELMHGHVGVDSQLGMGSTFWFTTRLGLGRAGERRRLPAPDLRGLQVLVVDDNDTARMVLRELLQAMSFIVHDVSSGLDALAAVEAAAQAGRAYDVVYLDWQMPGIDGFETALRIRRLALAAPPRIVMVTAFGRDELLRQAERSGIGDVLMKPVSASGLFNTTMHVLGSGPEVQVTESDPGSLAMLDAVRGAHVLLVEDNALNQEVACALLGEVGLQVDVAEDGAQALERVQQVRYDLVLMDMQMPVMDGVTATRAILALPGFSAPPIVAMTANAMQADRERCQAAGMCDFVSKPIEPEELWRALLQWIPPRPASALAPVPQPAPVLRAARPPPSAPAPGGTIDGLDQEAGLRRVLGRRELYQSLLGKFAGGQRDAVARMRQALAAGNWNDGERLAHTLKGVAGNIGATHVQGEAAAVETALRGRAAPQAVEPLLVSLEWRLSALCEALEACLPKSADKAGTDEPPRAPPDPAQVREACEHLRYLLISDSADVVDLLRTHEPLLRRAFPQQLEALAEAVNDYDFGQALTLLEAAMRAYEPA